MDNYRQGKIRLVTITVKDDRMTYLLRRLLLRSDKMFLSLRFMIASVESVCVYSCVNDQLNRDNN